MNSLESTWVGWLLWLMGFDASRIPDDAKSVGFAFLNMPTSWGVFVLLAVIAAIAAGVFLFYLRELDTCPRRVKLLLAGVRFAVLFILVLVFLSPALTYKQTRTREPYVVVMRDASQSMNAYNDDYQNPESASIVAAATGRTEQNLRDNPPSRIEVVNQLLERNHAQLVRDLQSHGKVFVMDFADQVERVATLPARPANENDASADRTTPSIPPLVARGRGTNIWLAVKEATSINPLAAVIVLTDGQHNAPSDLLEIAKQVREKGIRVFMVGVGENITTTNLAIDSIDVRPKVWPGEPFEIDAVVKSEGTSQASARFELIEKHLLESGTDPGPGKVVATKQVTMPDDGGRIHVSFNHSVTDPGRYVYTIQADPLEGESNLNDNQRDSKEVQAVTEESKVLLIAGAPTWEYRMVQRLLMRDSTISLSCWLQTLDLDRKQEGNESITKLPTTMQELAKYHVVLLFDPNPNEFDENWIELLRQFADKQSGGVLYMAGPKYSGQFLGGRRTENLQDILPVRFGDVQRTEVQSLLATNRRSWPLRIVVENVDHPVMSFFQDPQKNLALWEKLPGIFWSFPAVGAKPTAKVLLEHSDPILRRIEGSRPLLVTGRYGAANTVYVGFNGTWRWRRVGRQAEFFDKFWLQVTRFLIDTRTLQGKRRGYVEPERERYEIGDKIVLTANLLDATYEPLRLSQVDGTMHASGGETSIITFTKIDDQPGHYQTIMTARQEGEYRVEVELAGSEGSSATKIPPAEFRIRMPDIENSKTALNEPLLNNASFDGRYYKLNQLSQLVAAIPNATETIEVPGAPVLLWSEHQIPYRILGLMVLLLTVEWAFRKQFKLL